MSTYQSKKATAAKRLAAGLCASCGKVPPQEGRRCCQTCQNYFNEHSNRSRQKRIERGLCSRCGRTKTYQTYKICQDCRRKEIAAKRDKYERLGLCRGCGKRQPKPGGRNCQQCLTRVSKNRTMRGKRARLKILAHYGARCACCGEDRTEFLTIDHLNRDGAAHRRQVGRGNNVYLWIVRHNFPPNFRILCFNCNCAMGIYGYCPHEKDHAST